MELNVDSLAVAMCLQSGNVSSVVARSLVKKIQSRLQGGWEVRIGHIYCEANRCEDALTSIGCTQLDNFLEHDVAPSHVLVSTTRLVATKFVSGLVASFPSKEK